MSTSSIQRLYLEENGVFLQGTALNSPVKKILVYNRVLRQAPCSRVHSLMIGLVTVFIQNACLHVQKDDIMHRTKSFRSRYLRDNNQAFLYLLYAYAPTPT